MSRPTALRCALLAAVLITGFGIGFAYDAYRRADCSAGVRFVNPGVVCGAPDVIWKTGYARMRSALMDFVETEKAAGRISGVAVYFRDLRRGPVMGINETEEFAPASLLKLPLALVFMAAAEEQPEVLDHKITYDGTTTVALQRIAPAESASPGAAYPIGELLRLMLQYSDNAAYEVLESFLQKSDERQRLRVETFQELGLIDPRDRVEATISVRGYASLFRILYNASYLNYEHSETILAWLSDSDYDAGIVAGVPEGIDVSHKFGERLFDEKDKELHDCGIVYYPDNPYLLCVMTRGGDWTELERAIATVSRMIYEEVDSRRL